MRIRKNMKFEEKYTSDSDRTIPENKDKKVLSDDVYALIEQLIEAINYLRIGRK